MCVMEFRSSRQEIDQKLSDFLKVKIKEKKIYVPLISKKNLKELLLVGEKIEKEGLPSYLVLKKLEKKLGHGIFLHPEAKPILKGEVIAPYTGKVLIAPQNQGENSDYTFYLISDLHLTKEEQAIWNPTQAYHPRRVYSIDLDAEKIGNFTRFINHSQKPNLEAIFYRIPATLDRGAGFEILYVAKTKILPGEQLLVSYEGEDRSYWGAIGVKPFPMTPKTFQLDASLKLKKKLNE